MNNELLFLPFQSQNVGNNDDDDDGAGSPSPRLRFQWLVVSGQWEAPAASFLDANNERKNEA